MGEFLYRGELTSIQISLNFFRQTIEEKVTIDVLKFDP